MGAVNQFRISIEPGNTVVEAREGETLLDALTRVGRDPATPCGGNGRCGKCTVTIRNHGDDRVVLACETYVHSDMTVWVDPDSELGVTQIVTKAVHRPVDPCPNVTVRSVALDPPSLQDQRADVERLNANGPRVELSPKMMADLPEILRDSKWNVRTVAIDGIVRWVEPGTATGAPLGIAVDVGTTTVAAYLLDLDSGKPLAVASGGNPQASRGHDVVTRIGYTMEVEAGLSELSGSIKGRILELARECCQKAGVSEDHVYEILAVGNPTMICLLLGVPPRNIAAAPYIPPFTGAQVRREFWHRADLVTLPAISGYVGADTVGMVLSAELDKVDEPTLAIDIGTNGEIVLAGPDRILACSAAAGPAFEGAQISQGMRAAPGAIDHVWMEDGDLAVSTIGNMAAIGICGTGLADAVAVLLEEGAIEETGRCNGAATTSRLSERIEAAGTGTRCKLAGDVWLTQKDVRELQLAKGAIRAGSEILMKEMGITARDLGRVVLAGAFGSYLSPQTVVRLGLLPEVSAEAVESVGNAAGSGAIIALLSTRERARANQIAERVEHIELASRMDFQEELANSMLFG